MAAWPKRCSRLAVLPAAGAGCTTARISLVCPTTAVDLADGIPPVDVVVPLAGLRGRRTGGVHLWATPAGASASTPSSSAPQAPHPPPPRTAGIPQRSGVGGGMGLLLTGRVRPRRSENQARRRGFVLRGPPASISNSTLPSMNRDRRPGRRAVDVLHGSGLGDGRLVVAIAPGAGYAENPAAASAETVWDPERWAHLANQLAQRHGAGILVVGSAHDRLAAEHMKIDLRAAAIDLVGEIDLATLAGVIARCDLLVGSDTPLLQLAMDTPTVGLFGPTDGARGGAYGAAHRVVQAIAPPRYEDGDIGLGDHGPDPSRGCACRIETTIWSQRMYISARLRTSRLSSA